MAEFSNPFVEREWKQLQTCPFLDPEYDLPIDQPCSVCGASGRIEDWTSNELHDFAKLCDEAGGECSV